MSIVAIEVNGVDFRSKGLFVLNDLFTYLFIYLFLFSYFYPLFHQGYTVEQKRIVFFKFVELFHDQNFPQELKAKVLFTINLVS